MGDLAYLESLVPISGDEDIIHKLYPALVECFAVIICGYLAGRMNLISDTESRGLSTFVGTFALPALIFLSLAELDLTSVNWYFLGAVLLAKSLVFITVAVVTLLGARPVNIGRAGLFSIFCTQSNDFAIGYPIVVALYQSCHPEYASYLYLMAPISLIILNPIGFVLMEIHKRRLSNQNYSLDSPNSSPVKQNKVTTTFSLIKGVFFNPVVMMTALGVIGNFVFKHRLPLFLSGILKVLGSSFSATALFLLGLRMVGKVHTLQGRALVLPGILIIMKLLVLPIVTREVISFLHVGANSTDTVDLSTFGFLYGTFPAAPGVFVFATQYNIDMDLVASAMVACTFISAPLMFISAKMITISNLDPNDFINEIESFVFDLSIAAILACAWLMILFFLTKKYKRLPHRITCCLIVSQIFTAVGIILWSTLDRSSEWGLSVQFVLLTVGIYSSRLWTAFLAIVMLLLHVRSLCFILRLQIPFMLVGWGVPIALAAILIIFDKANVLSPDLKNPNFQFGEAHAAIAVFLLVFCFIVTVSCLILLQRYTKRRARYLTLANDIAASNSTIQNIETLSQRPGPVANETQAGNSYRPFPESDCQGNQISREGCSNNNGCCGQSTTNCSENATQTPKRVIDIEDLARGNAARAETSNCNASSCPSAVGCGATSNEGESCQGAVATYTDHAGEGIDPIEIDENYSGDQQILRHSVLLIILLCSMFIGISITIWTLVMDELSGIYVELSFLDATLNFGQALLVFAVFGLDTKEILLPLLKMWRVLWYGSNILNLPKLDDLSEETKHICSQFTTHHLKRCCHAIAKDTRWRIKIYKKVFKGSAFVDWLINVGLARDRVEAINYAKHLIDGRILRHINNVHHFYDRSLLYTFIPPV